MKTNKYKLNVARDVDYTGGGYMLCLPAGFRFYDDLCHTKGFDTMQEVKAAAKSDVVPCDCEECVAA